MVPGGGVGVPVWIAGNNERLTLKVGSWRVLRVLKIMLACLAGLAIEVG